MSLEVLQVGYEPDALGGILVLLLVGGAKLYDKLTPDPPEEGSPEAAREAYAEGEIDEAELERRLELALDPNADKIRNAVEPVSGVGPATSAAIAEEFESLDAVRAADQDDLEDIHGIGPSTAEAITERFD